jgi:branched-chain amino acid transport system permease protein
MIPFLIFSLATIGLNILTGLCGQLSLGTGAFMGVGAYACYKLTTFFPDVNIIIHGADVGVLLCRHRHNLRPAVIAHQGLYLAVTTLAAQFFLEWCFIRIPWLYNYNASGAIEVPRRGFAAVVVTGCANPTRFTRYLVLAITWHRSLDGKHRARADRAAMDDDPRHGHCR